jgi:prolyl-tRNA synthetase
MGKEKKFVQEITSMEVDFAQWYTDIVIKADLVDYSSVRGCLIIRPYGYSLWENIQKKLDTLFKETGHENVYMPLLIPESLLQKEKDHIEGFAPEVAWVTHGGNEKLAERLCVRPTSETLFCEHYAKIIRSYRDLPKLYNQWGSVVRWEKTTRPFLRTLEFLWQEGHTCHATKEEAEEEALQMLQIYTKVCEEYLAIPVIQGKKTDKEKFAGARSTYTIESLMHDGKALQTGTSHYLGDGFAQSFDIQYLDKEGQLQYVHQTSWGITTRLIGVLIMVHGDDNGLIIPPRIAPIEVVIIPIAQHKEGVLDQAYHLRDELSKGLRVHIDSSDKKPGWKFSEYEMKGVPLRIEIGPKDIENNQVVLVRRDTREKQFVSIDQLKLEIPRVLSDIQFNLLEIAKKKREEKIYTAHNYGEFKNIMTKTQGFIKAMWCGERACEDRIKEETGTTSRCIPFNEEKISDTCVCCDGPAKQMVYWARAY